MTGFDPNIAALYPDADSIKEVYTHPQILRDVPGRTIGVRRNLREAKPQFIGNIKYFSKMPLIHFSLPFSYLAFYLCRSINTAITSSSS